MGWFGREAQIIENTVVRVGDEEIEKIAHRVASIVLKETKAVAVVLLETALTHLDPKARVVREGG